MTQFEEKAQSSVDVRNGRGIQVGDRNSQTNIFYSKDPEEEDLAEKLNENSPYKGLEVFTANDTSRFYGRKKFIEDLIQYLDENNLIFLLGASGTGKSSLIQAGLIPELSTKYKDLYTLCLVPNHNPFKSLSRKIESFLDDNRKKYKDSEADIEQLVEQLTPYPETKETLVEIFKKLKVNDSSFGLVFIDQFEEVFTLCEESKQTIFMQSLANLIKEQDSSLKIIFAMRNDFYSRLDEHSEFISTIQGHIRNVVHMTDRELKLVIKNPAAKHGVAVEPDLIEQIVDDFRGQSRGSLPLLQYTLDLLWQEDDLTDRVLNKETYEKLGKVGGALQQKAEKIYKNITKDNDKEIEKVKCEKIEQIFINLITITSDGTPVSKRESKASFNDKEIIDELINNRLLVSGRTENTIEITHEALIKSWETLQKWIEKHKEVLILQRQLIEAAKTWDNVKNNENKATSELWRGFKLERVLELKKENAIRQLDPVTEAFIQASIEYRDRSEQEKLEIILDASISNSQFLFAANNRLDALMNLIKVGKTWQKELKKHESSRIRFLVMLGHILSELAEYNCINAHNDEVASITCSPDETIIASASYRGIIRLWNADGIFIDEIKTDQGTIGDLTFSSDGQILASASSDMDDGSIKLWKISTSNIDRNNNKNVSVSELNRLVGHLDRVNSISFRPGNINLHLKDEMIIASASQDGTIKLWSLQETPVKTLENHNKSPVKCVVFSPDGKMIASGDEDGFIKLWTHNGEHIASIEAHTHSVTSINFCPDSKVLISSGRDKRIKFWNTDEKKVTEFSQQKTEYLYVTEFYQQDTEVLYVNFSPDGRLIAATDIDGNIKVWFDNEKQWSQESKLLITFKHEKEVPKVIFSKDSKKLISCSYDKTIKFWNCCSKFDGYDNGKFHGHTDRITWIQANFVDKVITTTSKEGTVKAWNYDGKLLQNISSNNYENEDREFGINVKNTPIKPEIQINSIIEGIEKIIEDIQTKYGNFSAKYFNLDCGFIAVAFYGEKDGYQKINRVRLWNLDLDKVIEEAELYTQNYQKSADKNKNVIS